MIRLKILNKNNFFFILTNCCNDHWKLLFDITSNNYHLTCLCCGKPFNGIKVQIDCGKTEIYSKNVEQKNYQFNGNLIDTSEDFGEIINKFQNILKNNDGINRFHITPGTGGVPVHFFIDPDDPDVIRIAALNNDDPNLIFNWISNNIEFVSDFNATRRFDRWNYPSETINLGMADCEDASILYVSFLIRCGRLAHIVLGEVIDPVTQSWSSHAFVEFFNDEIDEWQYLEPTSNTPLEVPWNKCKIHGLVSREGFFPNFSPNQIFSYQQSSSKILNNIKLKMYRNS